MISEWIAGRVSDKAKPRRLTALFVVLMAAAALMVTVLLAFQEVLWAAAYRVVGALADSRAAMLYPLSAITGYGHAQIFLDPH
jgi:predicted MFS family arabinose efflux permease